MMLHVTVWAAGEAVGSRVRPASAGLQPVRLAAPVDASWLMLMRTLLPEALRVTAPRQVMVLPAGQTNAATRRKVMLSILDDATLSYEQETRCCRPVASSSC